MSLIEIGYVAKAHGVAGEVRIVCHNPDSQVLLDVEQVVIGEVAYAVSRARAVKDAFLVLLDGVRDRDVAASLRGQPVLVDRESIELDEDEFLLADLIGCQAVLASGAPYGVVVEVEPGPQDRLVIEDGEVERLVPLVDEIVLSIDFTAMQVVIDPPPGLPESRRRKRGRPGEPG